MLESGESVPILLLANKVSAIPTVCYCSLHMQYISQYAYVHVYFECIVYLEGGRGTGEGGRKWEIVLS